MFGALYQLAMLVALAAMVLGIIAMSTVSALRREIDGLHARLQDLTKRIYALEQRLAGPPRAAAPAPQPSTPPVLAAVPPSSSPPARPTPAPPAPAAPVVQPTYSPCSAYATPIPEPLPGTSVSDPNRMEHLEADIGKRWITWVGVVALFFAVAFFVKLAINNGWLTHSMQIVLGIVFGLILLIAGDRAIRRGMRPLGEGLLGGGLAMIYVSLFAGFALYHLFGAQTAFAAMVLLTIAGLTLAVLHDAMMLFFLALIGGFLTPVMVSTGQNARDTLLAYLLLLDLGVLAVAYFKRWRAVDLLALAGTWALFAGWFANFYSPAQLIPALCWVGAFYLVFLVLPFTYHLHYQAPVTVERFILTNVNVVISFTYACYVLMPDQRTMLGFVALAISASMLAMGSLTRWRVRDAQAAFFGFIALSVAFLTLAIPLQLRANGVMLAWAVEGPVLLYLGYQFRYFPVRIGGMIVLALTVGRLFLVSWPLHAGPFILFANKSFISAMAVVLSIAACATIHQFREAEAESDDRVLKVIAAMAAGFLALLLLHVEVGAWLRFNGEPQRAAEFVPFIWTLGGVAFIAAGLRLRNLAVSIAGLAPFLAAAFLILLAYDDAAPYSLLANPRFLVAILIAAALFCCWWQSWLRQAEIGYQQFLFGFFEFFLFLIVSFESYTWGAHTHFDVREGHWIAQMSLSITWGLYAIVLLTVGFQRRSRAMRLTALSLFGMTAVKLLVIDLSFLAQIYRIVSFLIIGLLMIGASYLYHHIEKTMAPDPGDSP